MKVLNEPRYPKLPDMIKAKKKEVKQIVLADLKLTLSSASEVIKASVLFRLTSYNK